MSMMAPLPERIDGMRVALDVIRKNVVEIQRRTITSDDARKLFGKLARELRCEKYGDRSLRSIAKKLGISATFLSQLERGENWSNDVAVRILQEYEK